LHDKELHNLYSSADVIGMTESRMRRWAWGEETYIRILVGKPEGKRPVGRPRHRWDDSTKNGFREIGWGVWIDLIWRRIRNNSRFL
jgi:hypothetical protein